MRAWSVFSVLVASVMTGVAAYFAFDQWGQRRDYAEAVSTAPATLALDRDLRHQTATWYAKGLRHPDRLTAASRRYPRGTRLVVEHDCRLVTVTVTDHGPEAWTGHEIDLSRGAFRRLAPLHRGVIPVRIREVLP